MLNQQDAEKIVRYFKMGYEEHGYSPKALHWDKGKQDIRFDILTSGYDGYHKHILDIGCGFGDLNQTLCKKWKEYRYTGIDITPELIAEAGRRYGGKNVRFYTMDFLAASEELQYDYAVLSGTLNYRINGMEQYEYAFRMMEKAYRCCRDGFAFDFLSDKVDYQLGDAFHYAPERVLALAYQLSRNVCLRNDYMPFEFSLFVYKDDSFEKEDTMFCRYKRLRKGED